MLLPLLGLAALLTAAYVGGRSAKKAAIEAENPGLFVTTPATAPQIAASPRTSASPRASAFSQPGESTNDSFEDPAGEAFPQLRPRLTIPKASGASLNNRRPSNSDAKNKIPAPITATLAKIKARTATAQECLEGMAWLAAKSPQSNPSASPFYAGLKQAKGEVEASKILARFRAKQLEKRYRGR